MIGSFGQFAHQFSAGSIAHIATTSTATMSMSSKSTSANRITTTFENDRVVTIFDPNSGIAQVILNRPDKLNALDMAMFRALSQAARSLQQQQPSYGAAVRVVIVRGRGRAFCTGLDVPSFGGRPFQNMRELLDRYPVPLPTTTGATETTTSTQPTTTTSSESTVDDQTADTNFIANNNDEDADFDVVLAAETLNLAQEVGYLWRRLPVPVLCCLHGMCYGGGLQIALGADIRIATADCRLSIMESKWGLIPDMSASVTLRELLRIDVAKELTFTGRIVSGTEAASLGLVTHVVENNSKKCSSDNSTSKNTKVSTEEEEEESMPVVEYAMELAHQLAQKSPDALRLSKQLYQSTWVSTSEEYCLQIETQLQKQLLMTWNQVAAAGRNFGWKLPYFTRNQK